MTLERFSGTGLEVQRLGQGRLELSAGGSGSVDTLVVGGVDLLPGGAVAFNSTLGQTALDVAAAINANTDTHGFQRLIWTYDTRFASEVLRAQQFYGFKALRPEWIVDMQTSIT